MGATGPRNRDLNPKQAHWLRLYLGRDPDVMGNATACYRRTYGVTDDRIAQQGGSRLLTHPKIKPLIEAARQKAIAAAGIDAQFVLDQSLRLYDIAMGDLPTEREVRAKDATGRETVTYQQTREYDPATAHKALTMLGNNKHVGAFQTNVEVTHTHYLEERLQAKTKAIEGKAQRIDDTAPALADDTADPAGVGDTLQRGSISAEVNANDNRDSDFSSFERAGATGK